MKETAPDTELGNAFFTVGNSGLAGFADLYFITIGFQFVKDFYAFPFADRTKPPAP
jgi:hypothetical protein